MDRIAWERHGGEEIEHVVAMFLASDHPSTAQCITPSKGDGGIDILVTLETGYAVYQVKCFTGPLGSAQKNQVRKSMDALCRDPRVKGLDVREWHLVMPWGPTLESFAWVAEEAAQRGLPKPIWHGLAQCDGWAATYPHIVDYYFYGRQQTIQDEARKLVAAFGGPVSPDEDAAAALERMQAIATSISDRDPHYAYAFSTIPMPPGADPEEFLNAATRNIFPDPLIASLVLRDGHLGVLCVYYKTRASQVLAPEPITVKTTTTLKESTPEHQAVEAFRTYGRAVELTDTNVTISAPGGLTGEFTAGRVRITPHGTFPRDKIRGIILAPDNTVLAELPMTRTGLTTGPRFHPDDTIGIETTFMDDQHILTLTLRVLEGPVGEMSSDWTCSLENHPAAVDALPTVEFLAALHRPNRLLIAPRYELVNTSAAMELPVGIKVGENAQVMLEVARALVVLQDHTPVELCLRGDTDYGQAIEAAAIVSSAQVQYEGALQLVSPPEAFTDHGDHVELRCPLVVELPETALSLGEVTYQFHGTLIGMTQDSEHGSLQTWSVNDGLVLAKRSVDR